MSVDYSSDPGYAGEKLNGSWIRYKDGIACVLVVGGDGTVVVRDLLGKEEQTKLNELDLTPVELGFVNFGGKAPYLARMPARHYRQGFRENILRSVVNGKNFYINYGKELLLAHKNMYPSINNCVEEVYNGEVEGRAFCKKFAIIKTRGDLGLSYKDKLVGIVDHKKDKVVLNNKFLFLEEVLKECL